MITILIHKKFLLAIFFLAVLFVAILLILVPRAFSEQPVSEQRYVLTEKDFQCAKDSCVTFEVRPDFRFSYLAVEWETTSDAEYRVFEGRSWSEWKNLKGEADHRDADNDSTNVMLVAIDQGVAFQFRVQGSITAPFLATVFRFPVLPTERPMVDFHAANATPESLVVTSRLQWLDSSLELAAARRDELWPPAYEDSKKIIIHHTASEARDITKDGVIDASDYRELVRAIYHYHASSRRWGDIGYQYIIDPLGTIYEGKSGGDGIAGGHAIRGRACTKFGTSSEMSFNNGTIGIALLGTYSVQELTQEAKESLTSLIALKSWEFGFEPAGSSYFQDRVYPNILGHRDVDCTDCPGNTIAASSFEISAVAQQKFQEYSETHAKAYRAEIFPEDAQQQIQLSKGEQRDVTLRFKNTGSASWRGYGSTQTILADSTIKKHLASLDSVHLAAADTYSSSSPPLILARMSPMNVRSGEVGTFTYTISDASQELVSERDVVLALGERGWFTSADAHVRVENTGIEWAGLIDPADTERKWALPYHDRTKITLHFTNRGTSNWKKGDVQLSFDDETSNVIRDETWEKKTGNFDFVEEVVQPGGSASFVFFAQPSRLGEVRGDVVLIHGESVVSGSNYTGLWMTAERRFSGEVAYHSIPSSLLKSGTVSASLSVRNSGLETWDQPSLIIVGKDGKTTSVLKAPSWKSQTIAGQEGQTRQGEIANFIFDLNAPKRAGTVVGFLMIKDGKNDIPLIHEGVAQKGEEFSIIVKEPPKKSAMKKVNAKKAAKSKRK